ncbi:acyl carrier protein [Pseudomonas aeruginosa]|uniref:acyl carrier protein n=1 Tax=Pseudomonadota TaxID=1224 RepID=UPI0012A9635D|nr:MULTISPECIES: acyl carrier protein [Pseudomonadota]MBP8322321.1 acyl carrier protein [Pseudomonas aeruginosa]CUR68126.1 acyl carrier protein [Achromobacter xylosoxidans]
MSAPLGAQEERAWLDAPGVRGMMSRLLVENFDVEPHSLYSQARLDEDLCLDSLELVDFGMMLESQSGIELDVRVLNLAITLGDLADLVEAAQEQH